MTLRRPIRARSELDQAKRPDLTLLGIVGVLTVFGLLAVYSASFAFAIIQFGDPNYFILRQAGAAVVGLVALVVMMRIDYHRWLKLSPWLMLGAIGILIIVLLPGLGFEQNGARSWVKLGPLPAFQPSEFIKLGMFIYIAAWLATRGERLQDWWRVFPFIALLGTIGLLMLLQNDFGTAVLMLSVAVMMFFVAGANPRHLLTLAAIGLVASPPMIIQAAHRWDRIRAFIDPWSDPQGAGYHIIQALIALGSGGLFGLGLGESRQKFLYVPSAHADAIFAIIGEELGLVGCIVVLLLLGGIAVRGFKIALEADTSFGSLLAFGITAWFMFQAAMNIGGITQTIPFTGIPLPFVSFGGSALVANLAALGVLLNISRFSMTAQERKLGMPAASQPTVLTTR
jgi:cell division protein FtsW